MKFDINDIVAKFKYDPNSVKKNYDGKTDVYLAKVSYRYAYVKRILIVLLMLVTIAFILSGSLTYENMYYLVKDLKLANDYVNSVHDTITYNVGNSQSFAAYREGLAVASREKLSIFSAGGREIFSSNHSYGNPTLIASEQYVLLYDIGGKQFSLYNSFSNVSDHTLDYAIYGASISDSGSVAIITKSESFDSVVSVYQSNGTLYDYNYSSGRVVSVDLSDNGTQMAVVLVFSNGSEIRSEVRLYKVGSSDYKRADITFSGVPYAVGFFDGGSICVVGAHGVNTFNSNLSFVGEYLSDQEIYIYSFGDDNIAISHVSSNSGKTKVLVLDARANISKRYEFDDRVIDVALYRGYLFLQKMSGFERINMSVNKIDRIDMVATDFKMLVSDKNTLIVCKDSYAKFLFFNK